MADDFLSSGIDLEGESQRGRKLSKKPGPDSILPRFARGGSAKRSVINALLGLSPGQQAARQSVELGDPLGAFIAGFGAQAGAPRAEEVAARKAALEAKQRMELFNATPIEDVSPELASRFGIHGAPLGAVQPFINTMESAEKFQQLQEMVNRDMPMDDGRSRKFAELAGRADLVDALKGLSPREALALLSQRSQNDREPSGKPDPFSTFGPNAVAEAIKQAQAQARAEKTQGLFDKLEPAQRAKAERDRVRQLTTATLGLRFGNAVQSSRIEESVAQALPIAGADPLAAFKPSSSREVGRQSVGISSAQEAGALRAVRKEVQSKRKQGQSVAQIRQSWEDRLKAQGFEGSRLSEYMRIFDEAASGE